MRDIKFRAWDEKNEMMVTDFYVNGHGSHNCVNGQRGSAFRFDKEGPFFCPKLFVMQFTGLLDRSGVEIYEGDILLNRTGTRAQALSEGCTYIFSGAGGSRWSSYRMPAEFSKPDNWEVIGNIYQNPELIPK